MANAEIDKNFKRFKDEQDKYLISCNEKIESWENFKNDYSCLKERLTTLPNELNYEIMVPISKVAFMPGKLIHTNEILVLLGENWFIERSTFQACQIIDRRLNNISNHLNDLYKEKNSLLDQMNWSDNLFQNSGEFINIEEKLEDVKVTESKPKSNNKKLTEEEKKELRRKQQERALKTQADINQKLNEDTKNSIKESESDDEDREKANEIKQSIQKPNDSNLKVKSTEMKQQKSIIKEQTILTFDQVLKDYEKSIDRENNNYFMEKFGKQLSSSIEISEKKKSVKWLDDVSSKTDDSDEFEDDYDSDDNEYDEEEKIRCSNVINIKHTSTEEIKEKERNLQLSRDKPDLDNPGDIYKIFYKPKPILKHTRSESFEDKVEHVTQLDKKENEKVFKCEPSKAFTGEIVERQIEKSDINSVKTNTNTNTSASISKFKANKLSK